jgi:two-component system nitrogen regulation sensor histidine kinase NtrY
VRLRRQARERDLLVRVATRQTGEGALEGYVVSFDDVTDLVVAQRMAAWGDVARRIAHEVKNPLTPIQLSAERLRRKFGPLLGAERAGLEQYADVIIRQTNDLRRIVDEFSKFARMPEPDRRDSDLTALVRDAITLQEAGQPKVRFEAVLPAAQVPAEVDPGMISQALTNLIKNAGEAIESYEEQGAEPGFQPRIRVMLRPEAGQAVILIEDNGIGLPEDRARLFEPYVTTRSKGTGLGLPIVKKIIEEHGGTLHLEDAEGRGARAVIRLPTKARPDAIEAAAETKQARRAV